ncbi:hypothetical protein ACQ4PT_000636 [Festuca glaucescens]
MASPARPAAASVSVSGAFGLPPDARCAFDQTRRRAEDLQDKRLVRTFVNVYAQQPQQQPQEPCYPKEAVMAAVEECMRKQAEGLLHSLEGIGGRLSQLELYCYKLERSIGELRSEVMDYHSDATVNFGCIDKNLRQVRFHSPALGITSRSVHAHPLGHYIPCSPLSSTKSVEALLTFSL